MGTHFSTRPAGARVTVSAVQSAGKAADRAVATELPASQSVTASDAGAGLGNDSHSTGNEQSHQMVLERSAAWFIDQVVGGRTGPAGQQYTDEASLRRSAYFRALHLTRRAPTGLLATDRKI
jgi:hypothetical protein